VATNTEPVTQRHRVRKVTRVIRDVDAWSVFKVAIVFHAALYIVVLITGFLLWNVGSATGTIDNVEQFLASFGWDSFTFQGAALFRAMAFFGLFGIALGAGIWVLAAVVFNLITELVGGVRVTVLEEEVVARTVEPDHTQR
jgi:polyferredoxin